MKKVDPASVKVVILCGGRGTRAYPFTEHYPKPMMPIGGKPIITHIMHTYAEQGYNDFVLAAGYKQEMLRDYFDRRHPDWNISVVDTGDDSQTGERIRRCAPLLGDTFFATYGDGLGNIDLNALLEFHRSKQALATLTTVPLRSQYGLVVYDDDQRVKRFEEKPIVDNFWINAGFFAFEKSAFDCWDGEVLEEEVLPALARKDRLYTWQHRGFWKSMDTSKDHDALEAIYQESGPVWLSNTDASEAAYSSTSN